MEQINETKQVRLDVASLPLSKIDLHNEYVLLVVQLEINANEMNAMIKEAANSNNSYVKSFYSKIDKCLPLCAKVSSLVESRLKESNKELIGKYVKRSRYAELESFINYDDVYDMDIVKDNFEFDNKQSLVTHANHKLKIRLYYLVQYNMIAAAW